MHIQLEATDVVPNTNRTQAAERAEKCRFLYLMTLTFDIWPWPSNLSKRGSKHVFGLPCEFGENPFSGSRDISYTNKLTHTDGTKNRTFRSHCVR